MQWSGVSSGLNTSLTKSIRNGWTWTLGLKDIVLTYQLYQVLRLVLFLWSEFSLGQPKEVDRIWGKIRPITTVLDPCSSWLVRL